MDEYKADGELLPCPLCGNTTLILHDNSKTASGWWIKCFKEDSPRGYHEVFLHYGTRQEVIAEWNGLPRTNFGG